MPFQKADLTGQRFGSLTVTHPLPNKGRSVRWATVCDCGKEHFALKTSLQMGKATRCAACYAVFRKKIDPSVKRVDFADYDEEFIRERVEYDVVGGCWLWRNRLDDHGYGVVSTRWPRATISAHRLSWRLFNKRPVPDGLFILHQCDTPACVNPDHLHLGTHADNMREMHERGRWKPPPRRAARSRQGASAHD